MNISGTERDNAVGLIWTMTCALCSTFRSTNPDEIYQHAIDEHQIALDDLRESGRNPITVDEGMQYKLPDGRVWLETRQAYQ